MSPASDVQQTYSKSGRDYIKKPDLVLKTNPRGEGGGGEGGGHEDLLGSIRGNVAGETVKGLSKGQ